MKVMLFWPGIGSGRPLGLPILQSLIKEKAHEVIVFDSSCYHSHPRSTRGMLYKSSNLKDNKPIQEQYIKEFIIGSSAFKNTVERFKPDIIGMSVFSTNFNVGMEYINSLSVSTRPFVIVGGVHATLVPGEVIGRQEVDAICVGEGEDMVDIFLDSCVKGALTSRDFRNVPNLWYKDINGKVIKNKCGKFADIEKIPIPDMTGLGISEMTFVGKKYRFLAVEISRGCPLHCSYCCNDVYKKAVFQDALPKIRRMSVATAIDRLIRIKEKYDINMFRFIDENFTTSAQEWFKKFCEEYRKQINFPFTISATASSISEDKVKQLKIAGCVNVNIGPESGNEEYRKNVLEKNESDHDYINACSLFKKYDIRVNANFLYGLPFQSNEILKDTINLIKSLNCPISTEFFLPLPGSKLYSRLKTHGLFTDLKTGYDNYRSLGEPIFISPGMTKEGIIAVSRTMQLYAKLPIILYPIIKICEKESRGTNRMLDILDFLLAV